MNKKIVLAGTTAALVMGMSGMAVFAEEAPAASYSTVIEVEDWAQQLQK
ncbi:MAG: hypothetical protein Q4B90_03820 [Eubacteriales bacterium]|nr:hypothetical protein [Eubacteriales bacterium]